MSELKATTVYDAYWKANSVGDGTGIQVYLKSEADKVIAEKDKELRRQKYKRCLKNREICVMRCDIEFARQYTTRASFCMKWERKWLELAEKFKEEK